MSKPVRYTEDIDWAMAHVSPTQLAQYDLCPRKWFFRYSLGHRHPATPAMLYGTEVHTDFENYYLKDIEPTSPEAKHALQRGICPPKETVLEVEGDIGALGIRLVDPEKGPRLLGYIDLLWADPETERVKITDWKTRSSFRYCPDAAELRDDMQAILYPLGVFRAFERAGTTLEELDFQHVNLLRKDKGGPDHTVVETTTTRKHVEAYAQQHIRPQIIEMNGTAQLLSPEDRKRLKIKRGEFVPAEDPDEPLELDPAAVTALEQIAPKKSNCFQYGRCEHYATCYSVGFKSFGKRIFESKTGSRDWELGDILPNSKTQRTENPNMTTQLSDLLGLSKPAPKTNGVTQAATPAPESETPAPKAPASGGALGALLGKQAAVDKGKADVVQPPPATEPESAPEPAPQADEIAMSPVDAAKLAFQQNETGAEFIRLYKELSPDEKREFKLWKVDYELETEAAAEAPPAEAPPAEAPPTPAASPTSNPAPNILSDQNEPDRQPKHIKNMTIDEFPWDDVDGMGPKSTKRLKEFCAEKGFTQLSEIASGFDFKEIPGVGPGTAQNIRKELEKHREFIPEGAQAPEAEDEGAQAPEASAESNEGTQKPTEDQLFARAQETIRNGGVPDFTGLSPLRKRELTQWHEKFRAGNPDYADPPQTTVVNNAAPSQAEAPQTEEPKPTITVDASTAADDEGVSYEPETAPLVLLVNCRSEKGIEAQHFDDLEATRTIKEFICDDKGWPHWNIGDYVEGQRLLSALLQTHADQFTGPILLDLSLPGHPQALEVLRPHAQMVIRG